VTTTTPTHAAASRGLDIAVRRVEGVPVCSLRVLLAGGARVQRIPGQAWLAGRMLAEGTASADWRAIAERVEDRGMSLHTFGAGDVHGLAIDALAGDWEHALDLAAQLLFESTFPPDRFDWVREQTIADLESLADQPEVLAGWAHQEQVYAPHPFAHPVQGTPDGLAALRPEDCREFHDAGLGRGAVIALAGELDEDRVTAGIERRFAVLDVPVVDAAEPESPRGLGLRREVEVPGEGQAHLYAGCLTVPRVHPELPALEILGVVLGAGEGLHGRLPARIREREGLAYAVAVQTASGAGRDPGRFVAYAGVPLDAAALAERALREELRRVREDGITPDELEEARGYLLGVDPFRRETARQWADLLAEGRFYGLPYDDEAWIRRRWSEVTTDSVRDVARRHLADEALRITWGLPGEDDG
jgi:zinc protease